MELEYIVADPAGNITGLVLTPLPRGQYKRAAKYLMEHSPYGLEQVGFVRDCLDCDGSLDMMGGEFCGNAARSFGLFLALNAISIQDDRALIRVSGAQGKLEVQTDLVLNEAKIKMPRILSMEVAETKSFGPIPVIVMEGICHALVLEGNPDQEKAVSLIREVARRFDADAVGVIYYEKGHQYVTPLVWVRDTDTTVWESSCGSGSVALAAYLMRGRSDRWTIEFKEPGGILKIEGGSGGPFYLSGPVTFSGIIKTVIPRQVLTGSLEPRQSGESGRD